jgi:hypothetical protein
MQNQVNKNRFCGQLAAALRAFLDNYNEPVGILYHPQR